MSCHHRVIAFTMLAFSPAVAAEDKDYDPVGDVVLQASVGILQAIKQSDDYIANRRFHLRGSVPGFEIDLSKPIQPILFRTNASGEWDTEKYTLQSYNIDMDLLSFSARGAIDGIGDADVSLALGYVQFSHDELMRENSDLSIKILDSELRIVPAGSAILGVGINILGYQNREYQDGTTLNGLDVAGLRFDVGFFDRRSGIEISLATEGDIGFGEGFVVDHLVDSRITLLTTRQKIHSRIQVFAKHNLHYNSARGENAFDGVYRVGARLILQYHQPET